MSKSFTLTSISYCGGSKTTIKHAHVSAQDGKFFRHYRANGGSLFCEITEAEFNSAVAEMKAKDGTVIDGDLATFNEY